jgi:hypothetical protein
MDPIAEASISNGLGYASASADKAPKVIKKENELEIRIEFG